MKNVPMKGIITPILTPMNPDETVNLEVLRQQIERLIEGGVHGIFPIGTNGEAYALSFDEKLAIIETCVDQVKGRVPVYAGTGCITTRETIELSKRAADLGADILSIITPSFAGNKLLPETVAKLAKDVDVIMGAKDSSGDWDNLQAYIRLTQDLDKGFKVLSGNDSLILKSLQAGGAGGIAGCSNVYPHVLSSIYNLFVEGKIEEAQAAQDSIASFRAVFKYGNPNTVVKKAAALLGNPVGECRRPFSYLSEEGTEALRKVLEENKAKGMA